MYKWVLLILALFVGAVNVWLNIEASRHVNSTLKKDKTSLVSIVGDGNIVARSEAGQHLLSFRDFFRNFLKLIWSRGFLWVFFIGCTSLLGLIAFYSTGTPPQKGIVLMGAISIVGGTLFAMFNNKKLLGPWELTLLGLIVLWFILRWIKAQ